VPDSTDISLKEYVDVLTSANKEAVNAALAAAQKAVDKAEAASERRFESVNEFRATLSDQARLLMPRLEAEQQFKTLRELIDTLTARVNSRDDRGIGSAQLWLWIVAAVGIVGTVFGLLR
jgi:predicted transcriptional regulator